MGRKCLLVLPVFMAVFVLAAGPAAAATLTVNTTSDETTKGDVLCSLREAIQAVDSPGTANGDCAPAAFGANAIVLGPGGYQLSSTLGVLSISPTVTTLTITGAGQSTTVIDASYANARVLDIPTGPSVTISNLMISGGHAANGTAGTAGGTGVAGGSGANGSDGGAILNGGSLTLSDVTIINSTAGSGGDGGSAFGSGTGGGNGGPGGHGGSGGAIYNTGSLALDGVTLANDNAGKGGDGNRGEQGSPGGAGGHAGGGGNGGAIANSGGGVTITASTIRGDAAGNGAAGGLGGPYNGGSSAGGGGGAGGSGGNGGALWGGGGMLSVTNSTIASNTSGTGGAGGGGGVGGNPAPNGGDGGSGGSGGAVYVGGTGTATVLNATVVGNGTGGVGAGGAAGSGMTNGSAGETGSGGTTGGVARAGGATVTLQNTLLAINAGGNCSSTGITDGGHNLSFSGTGCPRTFTSGDPNLGALQDNGGPTQTIALGAGSAAIGQVPVSGGNCPATDQRGVKRPSGAACDIGAYEVEPPSFTLGTVQATGPASVTVALSVAPNNSGASVWLEYGPTTAYGKKSAVLRLKGLTQSNVSLTMTGLKLSNTYHYRVVAGSADGTSYGLDVKLTVPVLSSMKVATGKSGAAKRRAVIAYRDNVRGLTTFTLLRHGRGVLSNGKCVPRGRSAKGRACQWVAIATFTHKDAAGKNRLVRKLAPGSYRLQAGSTLAGTTGRTVTAGFKIS